MPRALELDDLPALLVDDHLPFAVLSAVLDGNEEEGSHSDGQRIPLSRCIFPGVREAFCGTGR